MKKVLIIIFALLGFWGYSQTKMPIGKNYKKKVVKKSPVKKETAPTAGYTAISEQQSEHKPIEKISVQEELQPQQSVKKDYEIVAGRILKKSGWIKNRNSILVRGIEGFVKGVYTGKNKIYILIEIDNHSNINYDIENVSFITTIVKTVRRTIEEEEKVFVPIYNQQPESIAKKSKVKMIYVFDKFTISDNKTLLFIMNEINGERTVILDIKPKFISSAEYIK